MAECLFASGEWVLLCAWGLVLAPTFHASEGAVCECSFLGRNVGVCWKEGLRMEKKFMATLSLGAEHV